MIEIGEEFVTVLNDSYGFMDEIIKASLTQHTSIADIVAGIRLLNITNSNLVDALYHSQLNFKTLKLVLPLIDAAYTLYDELIIMTLDADRLKFKDQYWGQLLYANNRYGKMIIPHEIFRKCIYSDSNTLGDIVDSSGYNWLLGVNSLFIGRNAASIFEDNLFKARIEAIITKFSPWRELKVDTL